MTCSTAQRQRLNPRSPIASATFPPCRHPSSSAVVTRFCVTVNHLARVIVILMKLCYLPYIALYACALRFIACCLVDVIHNKGSSWKTEEHNTNVLSFVLFTMAVQWTCPLISLILASKQGLQI